MLQRLRNSQKAAFIAPLAVFLFLLTLADWLRVENPGLPWHQRAPELWIYPLQCVVCLGLLWFWRRHYQFGPWSKKAIAWAIALGLLGIGFWIWPTALFERDWLNFRPWTWLGVQDRREGFDPTQVDVEFYGPVVLLRFLRLVIVVPLVEEIFWRGFLMRALIDDGKRFEETPFGTFGWPSVLVTTVLFAAVHQPVDWAAALVFGALMAWLTVRQKSLGACVLMHAVANLILGIYVVGMRLWGLW